ncbi:MAG: sensor histidine kinase [Candidatus Dadabacteria bacterium]|nr:MAG: sensor histidine kinase [Candidatus Dadabacteria bacterium]
MDQQEKNLSSVVTEEIETSLKKAFKKFSEAGARLEAKYFDLQKEVNRLNALLSKKEKEVEQVKKLASVGKMAAVLAHEIRTPLGAMKLYLSLLEEKMSFKQDKETSQYVQGLKRGIKSLENLVCNILCFSGSKKLSLEPVRLDLLFKALIKELSSLYPGVSFKLSVKGDTYILGSREGLERAFLNIITNSIEAVKKEGEIKVIIEEIKSKGQVKVVVQDSGEGISEDIFDKIFDPFVSGKTKGTGLGLSIVQSVINQHGGEVSAKNLSPKGASIEVILPKKRSSIHSYIEREEQ